MPKGCKLGEALGYGLNHWDGLVRFLDDGRIEIDSNTVERSIRPLALTRKSSGGTTAAPDLATQDGERQMSETTYERRLLALTLQQGRTAPPLYRNTKMLLDAVATDPAAVSYAWAADVAKDPRIKTLRILWHE